MRLTVLGACLLSTIGATRGQPTDAGGLGPVISGVPQVRIGTVVVDHLGAADVLLALNTDGQALSALEFDIGSESERLTFSVASAATAVDAGKRIWESNSTTSKRRILIAGMNQTAIRDGTIATIRVQVTGGTPPGLYPLAIDRVTAASTTGYSIPILPRDGGVIVPGSGEAAPVISAIVNAASYASGGVSPGEIVVIHGGALGPAVLRTLRVTSEGVLSTSIAGTRVSFDGVEAPLIYTSQRQLSTIVPYAVEKRSITSVQVEYNSIRSAPFSVPVVATSPGVFTIDQSGAGQGLIVNADGTINGPENPESRGAVVLIYGTGEGQTQPPGSDGFIVSPDKLHRPLSPVAASVGGLPADVLYLGSAANQISGLFQANVRIPVGVTPGSSVPLLLQIGRNTQPGVTIAVK